MAQSGTLSISTRPAPAFDATTGESLPVLTLSSPVLSSATHLPALDGLRGLALLLVLVNHLVIAQTSQLGTGVAKFFHTGWVGVDLFFVLSGFLITGILWDAKGQPNYFRNFYARRSLRIFPLYYAAVFGTVVLLPLLLFGAAKTGAVGKLAAQVETIQNQQFWLWTYISNFAQCARDAKWYMAGHFWSLAVEEHFYLVWPAVIWLISDRVNAARFCLVIAAVALVIRCTLVAAVGESINVYFLTFGRMDSLALGGFVALAARGTWGLAPLVKPAKGIAIGLGTMLGVWVLAKGGLENHTDPLMQSVGFSILGVFFAAVLVLVVSAGERSKTNRVFSNATLRWLGKYSYGLYVFHHLILYVTPVLLPTSQLKRALGGSPVAAALVLIAVNAGLSLLAAFASWHLFEKHFLKLKRRFPASARRADPVAADARTPLARAA